MTLPPWFRTRKSVTSVPGHVLKAAHNLLDYLVRQRKMGAPRTLSLRKVLPDGAVIRAAFFGEQPLVEYDFSGSEVTATGCELTMEAGLLDLGSNSAAVASPPAFADTAPTLHFGETTMEGDQPFGGTLRLYETADGIQVLGELLPAGTDGEDAVATEAATELWLEATRVEKKAAQALLPGSCWTGLMHRHVQAKYGNPAAAYKLKNPTTSPVLQVAHADATEDEPGEFLYDFRTTTTALLDPNHTYDYWFAQCDNNGLTLYRGIVGNACAKLLLKALKLGQVPRAHRDRLEHYVLAALVPDTTAEPVVVEFETPVVGVPFAYGWKFNERGSEMAMVTFDKTPRQTRLWRRSLAIAAGTLEVTEDDGDATDFLAGRNQELPGRMTGPESDQRTIKLIGLDAGTTQFPSQMGAGWDAPVYCYFYKEEANDDTGRDTLEVVNSKFVLGSLITNENETGCYTDLAPGWPCVSEDSPDPQCASKEGDPIYYASAGYYTERYSSVRVLTVFASGAGYEAGEFSHNAKWHSGILATTDDDSTVSVLDPAPITGLATPNYTIGGFFTATPFTSSDGIKLGADECGPDGCECDNQSGSAVAPAYVEVSVECPATNDGFDLVGGTRDFEITSYGTGRFITEFEKYLASRDEVIARPTYLMIPAGSATGCAMREVDVNAATNSASKSVFTAPSTTYTPGSAPPHLIAEFTNVSVGDTGNGLCVYTGGDPIEPTVDIGDPVEMDRARAQCSGVIDVGASGFSTTSGSVFGESQYLKVTFLHADRLEERLDEVLEGTESAASGADPSLVATLTPPCGGITTGDPSGGVDAPALTYDYNASLNDDLWSDWDGPAFDHAGFGPFQLLLSTGLANAQVTDPERLPRVTANPALTYTHDYPSVIFPSFIGWA